MTHPHPAAILDLITFSASLVALVVLLRGWRRALQLEAKLLLGGLLLFTSAYSLCLFLEWSGLAGALYILETTDTIEDLIGALVPMWWAFVLYALLRDVAEQKLRASEARFQELFDKAPVGYHELDIAGCITRVNRTELEMLGYSAAEMLGRAVWEFAADQETSQQAVAAKLAGDIPPGRAFERTLRRKNGSLLPVLIEDRVQRDHTGRITGIRSTIHDIMKRKQVEDELERERYLLRTLIDNMPDNIFVKDTESRFIVGNIAVAQFMGAKTTDDLLGKTDFDFYPRQLAERYYADDQEVIRSGEPLVGSEEPAVDAAGNRKWYSTTKVPLRDREGRVIGLVGVSRDITKRKHAEQARDVLNSQLEAKNKELESILYVTSHDLRAPLVNIQGFSHELSRSCEQLRSAGKDKGKIAEMDEQVRLALDRDIPEALDFILSSASKMDALLSGLLRLSRLGSTAITIEKLDMNDLMANVQESMEYQVKQAGAAVNIEPLPPCLGDSAQINQVFSNLLDNALKFLDKSRAGVIGIYGQSEDGRSTYCVEDNGIGIAPEHQGKIFEIFHRLRPDEISGEGLGLTIVRHILDRHDGNVWVESEPGKGSKFFVSLPSD